MRFFYYFYLFCLFVLLIFVWSLPGNVLIAGLSVSPILIYIGLIGVAAIVERIREKKKAVTREVGKKFFTKSLLLFYVGALGSMFWFINDTKSRIAICISFILCEIFHFLFVRSQNQKAQKETSMKEKQVS